MIIVAENAVAVVRNDDSFMGVVELLGLDNLQQQFAFFTNSETAVSCLATNSLPSLSISTELTENRILSLSEEVAFGAKVSIFYQYRKGRLLLFQPTLSLF